MSLLSTLSPVFHIYTPTTTEELQGLIDNLPTDEWRLIDTSNITDMSGLFYEQKVFGDISGWDVSNVKDMSYMFSNSEFDGDISGWDVSSVENMNGMFANSKFTGMNGDISKWNIKSLKTKKNMFRGIMYNTEFYQWDEVIVNILNDSSNISDDTDINYTII